LLRDAAVGSRISNVVQWSSPAALSPSTFEYSPFISNDLVKSNEVIVMIGVASAVIRGVVIFHVAGATIHILLVLAAISLVLHFVRGARTA
jgi:hypothetical protein